MSSDVPRGIRLGVDVGDARVGLAASDPTGLLATPVATLARDREGLTDVDAVAHEALERGATTVVVGLPRNMDGTEGASAQACRAWASTLARHLAARGQGDIAVRLVDERLTTVDAHRALRGAGVPTREHRSRIDQVAAVMILQSVLEAERTTGSTPGEIVRGRKARTRRASGGEESGDL